MSTYSFKITKGKYQLSLSTTDKELVIEQFALWVKKSSEYVQKHKVAQCKDMVASQINKEKELTQKKIDEQLQKMPRTESVQAVKQTEKQEFSKQKKNIDIFLKKLYYVNNIVTA